MTHDDRPLNPDMSPNRDTDARPLRPAFLSGMRGKCPACDKGPLFRGFLKPAHSCSSCGEAFDGHEADDFPAYIVIMLVGHIIVPIMMQVNHSFDVPLLWQSIIWPTLSLILALAMIQPTKGAVIGLQWAKRMHGFAR